MSDALDGAAWFMLRRLVEAGPLERGDRTRAGDALIAVGYAEEFEHEEEEWPWLSATPAGIAAHNARPKQGDVP